MTWWVAFLLTCASEFVVVAVVAPAPRRRRTATDSLAANLFTHPLAWWLVTSGHLAFWPTEIGVCIAEAAIYASVSRLAPARAFATSFAANGVTVAMSFLL